MRNRVAVAAFCAVLGAGALPGATIARVVAFGDSLADNGNLFARIGYPPSPPYFNGRGSNGPVAVEYLANLLGVPLLDFAVYGATTGVGNIIDNGTPAASNGLPGVLTTYANARAAGFTVSPNDLYVIMGGPPNDFRASNLNPASIPTAVANQVALVSALAGAGAQHILMVGMPDLGQTPLVTSLGPAIAAQATLLSSAFNSSLRANLPAGVDFLDTFTLFRQVTANPSAYGFTNTTAPCLSGTTVCSTPGQYFFWDDVHPTTRVHEIAGAALEALAVPEPATMAMTLAGLAGFMRLRREGRRRVKVRSF